MASDLATPVYDTLCFGMTHFLIQLLCSVLYNASVLCPHLITLTFLSLCLMKYLFSPQVGLLGSQSASEGRVAVVTQAGDTLEVDENDIEKVGHCIG